MNIIKVKDFDSMQSITVSLARNGYLVTVNSITDENYKDYWEIKYCEFSEIKEKPIVKDHYYISSMEIHNNTKDVKCESLPDEKPSVVNDNDPAFKPVSFDGKEKPLIDDKVEQTIQPYRLEPRDNTPYITPHQDVSDNITDKQITVITSVSGN